MAESTPVDVMRRTAADAHQMVIMTRKALEACRETIAEADRTLARFNKSVPWPVRDVKIAEP